MADVDFNRNHQERPVVAVLNLFVRRNHKDQACAQSSNEAKKHERRNQI